MVSIEYREAIVEVLEILQYSDDCIIEKIPKKLIEFWQKNKSTTYKPNLDHNKSINEMDLKNKTKSIITMIYLNYLCDDEERSNINLRLKNNEEKYQQELMEKYNTDNIFKKHNQKLEVEENVVATNNMTMVEYRESIFKKIINIIKRFFHIN